MAEWDGFVPEITEHTTEVDGIRMRWLEPAADAVSGPSPGRAAMPVIPAIPAIPVIMVHGIPTSAELWRRVLPRVRGARPMAWEMVGYGGSIPAGSDRDISVARQADYLEAWLRATGIDRAVLVGHDLGGGVVQTVAVRRPALCAGLVLTNAIGYDAWPVRPMKLARRLHRLVRHVPDRLFGPLFRAVISRLHDPREIGIASARIHWAHYARHGGAAAFARQARSLDVRDTLAVADRLPTLDVPARIVWGDADPFLPMPWAHRFAADLGAEVRPIAGALHFTPEDRPGPIADAINEIVRGE